MKLSTNLRYHRRLAGLSADDCADILGIGVWTYRAWERKKAPNEPKYATLCSIARLFNTTPNILLDYSVQDYPDKHDYFSKLSIDFGSNLKFFRRNAGFSKKGFAEKIGVPLNTYSHWELGMHEPKYAFLSQLARELHASPDLLLGFPLRRFTDNSTVYQMFPIPCIQDQHGLIKSQSIKQLFMKIHEELIEFESAVCSSDCLDVPADIIGSKLTKAQKIHAASEAADIKTAVTTLEEAIGISRDMRKHALQSVFESNLKKGRLKGE